MFPRRLLTASVSLFLLQSAGGSSANAANSSSSTSTTSTTAASSTTTSTATTTTTITTQGVTHVENPAILGCRWPDDFLERFRFCAKRAAVDVGEVTTQSDLRYGVLNRTILDGLLIGCSRDDLTKCAKKVNASELDEFLQHWSKSVGNLTSFQECLQSNTEAMDRLCGADTQVARVVSGAAGLHLNLMNVLVRVKKERDEAVNADKNITDDCMRRVAETVHITAAMYIQSEHYMDNSILCWNVVHEQCDSGCAALATELNCLQSDCPDLSSQVLQDFGIWQWYFLNSAKARQLCEVKEGKCSVEEDTLGIASTGIATLFDGAVWRKKMREVAHEVEATFGVPIQVAMAVGLAALAAFCASCAALCAFRYGLCGDDTRTRRYSRLDEGERFEESSRSLTKSVDLDGLDD